MLAGLASTGMQPRRFSAQVSFLHHGKSSNGPVLSHTFSSINLGAAVAVGQKKFIIISTHTVNAGFNRVLNSASLNIGGNVVNLIKIAEQITSVECSTALLIGEISNFSTVGTLTFIYNVTASDARVGYAAFRATDIDPIPFDASSSASDPGSMFIDVPQRGLIIGVATNRNRGASTWSGITKRFDVDLDTNDYMTGAADAALSHGVNMPLVVDSAIAGNGQSSLAVAFKPRRI